MTESVFKPHRSGHHCKNDVFCGLLLSLNFFQNKLKKTKISLNSLNKANYMMAN